MKTGQPTDQGYQFGQQQSPEPALPPPAHQSYQNLSSLVLDASSLAPNNAAFVPTSDSPNRGLHHREHLYGGTTSNNNDSTNVFAVNYSPPVEFTPFDSMGNASANDGDDFGHAFFPDEFTLLNPAEDGSAGDGSGSSNWFPDLWLDARTSQ
ncbi:hypothetical protein BFW01_g8963 [Lasiodiplodia theobromae]|nr:hypothetical protein BFW01_g8963 [Lasiodiplodia theobromae]